MPRSRKRTRLGQVSSAKVRRRMVDYGESLLTAALKVGNDLNKRSAQNRTEPVRVDDTPKRRKRAWEKRLDRVQRQIEQWRKAEQKVKRDERIMRPVAVHFPDGSSINEDCIKRQQRKEVLHAKKVAGRSGASPGKKGTYKRGPKSEVGC